jgi:hypothetical protein
VNACNSRNASSSVDAKNGMDASKSRDAIFSSEIHENLTNGNDCLKAKTV